jgi:hypothetical protein
MEASVETMFKTMPKNRIGPGIQLIETKSTDFNPLA